VGEIFPIGTVETRDPPSLLYNGHHISFPAVKWPESDLGHPSVPNIEARKFQVLPLISFRAFMKCLEVSSAPTFTICSYTKRSCDEAMYSGYMIFV